MQNDDKALGGSLALSHNSVDSIPKVVGKQVHLGGRESAVAGPGQLSEGDGPDLLDASLDIRRVLPTLDDPAGDGRTHDVNDDMLAEEYRRGLRVGFGHSSGWRSLTFIL